MTPWNNGRQLIQLGNAAIKGRNWHVGYIRTQTRAANKIRMFIWVYRIKNINNNNNNKCSWYQCTLLILLQRLRTEFPPDCAVADMEREPLSAQEDVHLTSGHVQHLYVLQEPRVFLLQTIMLVCKTMNWLSIKLTYLVYFSPGLQIIPKAWWIIHKCAQIHTFT